MTRFWWYIGMIIINVVGLTVEIIALAEGNYASASCAVMNIPCLIFFVVRIGDYVSSYIKESVTTCL